MAYKEVWTKVPLKEICDIHIGRTPSRNISKYWGDGHPWLSISDMGQGKFISRTKETITDVAIRECNCRLIDEGTLLLSFKLSIGKVGFNTIPLYTNEAIAALPIKRRDLLDEKYLYWVLQEIDLERYVDKAAKGKTLNKAKLREILIPLPSLDEQRFIAAVLDKADALHEKRQQAIPKLDTLARSMFLDMFGDPLTNSKGWPMTVLGNHLSFVTSGSRGWAKYYSPSGARFIRSLDVRMNYISDRDAVYVVPPVGKETERAKVNYGDVLLTITGSRIGRVAPVPEDVGEAYVSQHVAILRLDDSFHPAFVSMFMSEDRGGQHQIRKMQYGQTKPGLNLEQIRNFKIPQVPLALQNEFVTRSDKIHELENKEYSSLRQLENLFKTLQQRAFTGELFTERGKAEQYPNELRQYV